MLELYGNAGQPDPQAHTIQTRHGNAGGFSPEDLAAIFKAFPPSEEIPRFDVPRFWSNTKLSDPDTIIALVLDKPTTEDLARTIVAFGAQRVLDVFNQLRIAEVISPVRAQRTEAWMGPIIRGVADAARQLNPA